MGKIISNGQDYSGIHISHTIVNESGTDLPNESKLQFTDGLKASDDNVNGKTVVSLEYFSVVNGAVNLTFDE